MPAASRTELYEPKHFARSRRDHLIGAGARMLPCVVDCRRSRAKIPRIQVFGAEARATGAGPVSRIRSWTRNRWTLNSESQPKCFHGAGTRAVQNYPGSASQILAMWYHSCSIESSWPLASAPSRLPNDLLANRCSRRLLAQSVRHGEHTRTIGRSLNGSQTVAHRAYDHSRFTRGTLDL